MVYVYFWLPLFIFMVFIAIGGCVGCFFMGQSQGIHKGRAQNGTPVMLTAYPTPPQANQGYNAGAQP